MSPTQKLCNATDDEDSIYAELECPFGDSGRGSGYGEDTLWSSAKRVHWAPNLEEEFEFFTDPAEQMPDIWSTVSASRLYQPENRIIVPVYIEGKGPYQALVDSGAQISLVPDGLIEELDIGMEPYDQLVSGIGPSNISQPTGEVFLSLRLDEIPLRVNSFLVLKSEECANLVVLAADFLESNKISVDLGRSVISGVQPDGSVWHFSVGAPDDSCTIWENVSCVAQISVTVAPDEWVAVPVKCSIPLPETPAEGCGITVFVDEYPCNNLCIVPGLVRLTDGLGHILVENCGTHPFRIRPGDIVGVAGSLSDGGDCELGAVVSVVAVEETVEDLSNGELAADLDTVDLSHLAEDEVIAVRELLRKNLGLFEVLGKMTLMDVNPHVIELIDETPIYQRARRFPEVVNREIEKQCGQLEQSGVIEKSSSAWSSPVVPVRKKDGSIRLCIDYRRLNAVTKADRFPLPNLSDAVFGLSGIKYFTSLDMTKGYYQMPLHSDSMDFTSFSTPRGQWRFRRMPFGLRNAPAAFQREMQALLRDFPWTSVIVYIDDILIMSETFEQHLEILQRVMTTLCDHGVGLNIAKCKWACAEVEFLGHVVSANGLTKPQKYVDDVRNFPRPTTIREMREFLGLVNFQRKFIPNCSIIMKPLSRVTGNKRPKGSKLVWTSEMEEAFAKLKEAVCENVTLAFPDYSDEADPLGVYTDASGYGMGACLTQLQEGYIRPIAYASSGFNDAELGYSTIERELAAIRWSVKVFRPFVFGCEFVIHTDHQPLVYLHNMHIVNPRLARTLQELSEYTYIIRYTPGRANQVADALSRMPHFQRVADLRQPLVVDLPDGIEALAPVPGGPNSLLNSILVAGTGVELGTALPSDILELRHLLVEELSRNTTLYGLAASKNVNREIKLMMHDGQLLCDEIITVFAKLFDCVVMVYYGGGVPVVYGPPKVLKYTGFPRVHLRCLSGVHYDPLREIPVLYTIPAMVAWPVRPDPEVCQDNVTGEDVWELDHLYGAVDSTWSVPVNGEPCWWCGVHPRTHTASLMICSGGQRRCALLDTGAQISCVLESIVREAGVVIDASVSHRVNGIGQQCVTTLGRANLMVDLGSGHEIEHDFVVFHDDDMQFCFIIGKDFMTESAMTLNFHDHTCVCGEEIYGMPHQKSAVDQRILMIEVSTAVHISLPERRIVPASTIRSAQQRNSQIRSLRTHILSGSSRYPSRLSRYRRYSSCFRILGGLVSFCRADEPVASVVPRDFLTGVALVFHHRLGHPGRHKLLALVRAQVWHPDVNSVIADVTSTCPHCQRVKISRTTVAPIIKITTSEPFELVSVDLVALPTTLKRSVCCLVAIDHYSKWLNVAPLKSKTAASVIAAMRNRVLPSLPRVPTRILTDNGPEFRARDFDELLNEFFIEHVHSTANRPQGNGLVERVNRTLLELLRNLSAEATSWENYIPRAVVLYNTTLHSELGVSPSSFLLKNAHNVRETLPLGPESTQYWKEGNPSYCPFKKGQKVLRKTNFKGRQLVDKLRDRFVGPYEVVHCNPNEVTYLIEDLETRVKLKVHHNQLRRYMEPPAYIANASIYKRLVERPEDACEENDETLCSTEWSDEASAVDDEERGHLGVCTGAIGAVSRYCLAFGCFDESTTDDCLSSDSEGCLRGQEELLSRDNKFGGASLVAVSPEIKRSTGEFNTEDFLTVAAPPVDVWAGQLSDICRNETRLMMDRNYPLVRRINFDSEAKTGELLDTSPLLGCEFLGDSFWSLQSGDLLETCERATQTGNTWGVDVSVQTDFASDISGELQPLESTRLSRGETFGGSRSSAFNTQPRARLEIEKTSEDLSSIRQEVKSGGSGESSVLDEVPGAVSLGGPDGRLLTGMLPDDELIFQASHLCRITRSKGSVPNLPNVQRTILEYKRHQVVKDENAL